jgi:hypothetical protein
MKRVVFVSTVLVLALAFNGCDKKGDSGSKHNVGNNIPTGYTPEGGEEVNGFILPPYPDPAENDKTLLGIDTNENGVRDDVERWLIFRYKDHHRIVTEIGFQTARAAQEILKASPKTYEQALVVDEIMRKAVDCNYYFESYADGFGDPILIDHTIIISTAFKTMQFNTEERIKAYLAYDKALSGGVYRLTSIDELKAQCSLGVNALLGE